MIWFFLIVILIVVMSYLNWQQKIKRMDIIKRFVFDASIQRRVAEAYPHLTPSQVQQVLEGLRDYFYCVLMVGGKGMLSMPSQAVDEAWHAFILSTKSYENFCQRAFGKFLHHHPAETMQTRTQATIGIKRTWNLACRHEQINPALPARLPRLFALDALLMIPSGFVYSLNCMAANNPSDSSYCASDIGGGCGGSSSGCSGGDSSSGDSGGSDGGSGCGGGCGGGGD